MSENEYASLTARLLDAARKAAARGPRWAWTRFGEELMTPTNGPGIALRNFLAALEHAVRNRSDQRKLAADPDAGSTLYYFYDMDIAPITYDFASYLALAEMERRQRDLDHVHVVIVPGRRLEKEFDDYQHVVTPQMRRARVNDILVPMVQLLPTCSALTVCTSKQEAAALRFKRAIHTWPDGYSPTFPISPHHRLVRDRARGGEQVFPVFKAPAAALETVGKALEKNLASAKPIVITLREYGYNPARNSNIEAWGAFARSLDATAYRAVFVRDTQTAAAPVPAALEGQIIYSPASFDPVLRMALYELAHMNLAVMHGPMELCWYNEACTYGLLLETGTAPQNTPKALTAQGFNLGGDLPFATARQHWYWQSDTLEAIQHAFADLAARLTDNPSNTAPAADIHHD